MPLALVTGGAGFIGSHLVAALLQRDFEVTVLDDLSSGRRDSVPAGVRFIEGSVLNPDDIAAAFEPAPDYVLHLAALFANQNSVEHPTQDLQTNGQGTLNILEASTTRRVAKVLNVSSSCVYGSKPVMREDDTDYLLDTPYAITKLLGEQYCELWARQFGLPTVSVRPFNAYGPNEYPGPYRNVIPNFIDLALQGHPLPITGTGTETRDFTFVQDTVAGILGVLLAQTTPGDVFNVGSGREISVLEIAQRINALSGNDAGVEMRPRRSWDHVARRRSDITKIAALCGFAPAVGVEDGLARTYEWFRSCVEPGTGSARPGSMHVT